MKRTCKKLSLMLVLIMIFSLALTSCNLFKPNNNSSENEGGSNVQKPNDDPTDDPVDDPTDNPTDDPTDNPTDDPGDTPTLDAEWASDFTVSRVFSDDMVVQRGEYIRVWGFADESQNGKKVAGSFKGVTAEALIENGEWCLTFKKLFEADVNPTEMKLYTDNKEIVFRGVLVGDVYMAIGQSNMEYQVFKHIEGTDATTQGGGLDAIDENSIIRLNNANPVTTAGVSYPAGDQPSKDLYRETQWTKTTVDDTLEFSALGYYFAKEIVEKTEGKIPVGVIEIGFGGAPIKLLMPNQVYEASGYGTTGSKGYIYNRHIAPFERYAIAGLIWYQGESNNSFEEAPLYTERLSALVEYMRGTHNLVNKDFPVFAVEFPSIYKKPADATDWRYMELGMIRSYLGNLPKVLDNSYIAVSCDVWNDRTFWNNLHPHCKYDQANRVADLASYVVYGQGEFSDVTGPILNKIEISADGLSAVLTFDNVGEGLKTVDGGNAVDGIVVFLADQYSLKYETPMSAEITAYNQITVTNGKKICGVAYNYESENYYGEEVNLCNSAGCPASAFNTGFALKEYPIYSAEDFIDSTDATAGLVAKNIDTLKADGVNVFSNGGVSSNLISSGYKILVGDGTSTLSISGWIGFEYEILLLGYSVDGSDSILNAIPKSPEQGVINAAGQKAKRYNINASISDFDSGKHTVSFIALIDYNGTEKIVDFLTIEVVYDTEWNTYGPFDVVITDGDTNTISDGVTVSSGNIKTNRTNDRGVNCIGDLTGVGKKVTFYINSSKNEKVALYMEVNNYDTAKVFSDWADLSVNGTGYSSSAAMPVGNSWTPSNKQVFIAYIDLKEGNNDIVFTVNTAELAYNIYGIKLAAESAILTWGSKDIVAGDEEDNNESKTEIFYAVTSDGKQATGVTISGGLAIDTRNNDGQNSDRTNAAGHGCIKGFNNVGGALTFNINSSAEKKVDLYGEFSFTNTVQLLSEWITLTVVNSKGTKTYDLGDASTLQGINYTPSDAFIFLSEIDLTEGDNQIIITSSSDSNGLNVWGIKLASKSAAVTISTTEE